MRTLLLAALILASTQVKAENKISGKVVGAQQQPLNGAMVRLQGDDRYSAMTKEDGTFEITLPDYATAITVSAPMYGERTVGINEKVIQLYSKTFSSDKQGEMTFKGNSTSLTVEDELSTGLLADVRTVSHSANPAEGAAMFINGYSSLWCNSQPLVIVDGVLLDRQTDLSLMHEGYFNNVLSAISVNDIEKVRVLKNGTALYGAKGANGVIIIETKRAKSMATRIDLDVWAGIETLPKLPSMMGVSDYRLYASDIYGNGTTVPDYLDDFTADKQKYATYHNDTDWKKLTYRKAVTQNYAVNVQGGDDIASYNLSIGYTKANSTLKNNDFSRLNLRFNTDVKILQPLTCRLDVAYSNTTRDLRDDGFGSNIAPGTLGLVKSPQLSPYMTDKDGNTTSSLSDYDVLGLANPVSILENGEASNKNRLEYSLFTLNVMPEWKILKNLTLSERISYTLNNLTERYFLPDEGVPAIANTSGIDTENQSKALSAKQISLQSDTRIAWTNRYLAHTLNVMAGFRYYSDSYNSDGIQADNSAGDKMPNITSSMSNRLVKGDVQQWKSTAAYVYGDWNYASRYFLQASLTAETSTRFGKNAEGGMKLGKYVWGFFPSVQAAWQALLNPVKLRLHTGIDIAGNDDINPYASRTYFVSTPFLNQTAGLTLGNIGNDKLKWETTTKWNIGFDFSMLQDRLVLSFNYYLSRTSNMLTYKTLDGIGGIQYYMSNDGKMKNSSFDATVRWKAMAKKDFTWEVAATIGHYKNTITALPDGADVITKYCDGEILTREGSPLGLFYGYKTSGVFSTTEQAQAAALTDGYGNAFTAGDVIFCDLNGDHVIDANDKTVIGDPNPDIYGNISTSLTYKRWEMDIKMNCSLGGDVYNYARQILESGSSMLNQTTALTNRWTVEGQQTIVPKVSYGDPMGNSRFSDRWIENGSYAKLKLIRLSYTQPLNVSWIQGFTVWVAVNNLVTFTKYLGSDPEVSASNSPLFQGVDTGLLGHGRSFNIGVKVNL